MLYVFDMNDKVLEILTDTDDILSDVVTEQINGEFSYELTVDTSSKICQYLTEFNKVGFMHENEFYLFTIRNVNDEKSDYGQRTVYCEHDSYDLMDNIVEDRRVDGGEARVAVERALTGSKWAVGNVAELGTGTVNFYYQDSKTNLQEVVNTYGGELKYRIELSPDGSMIAGRYVDLIHARGTETGLRFEFDKNMDKIKRTVDTLELKNAYIGRGKAPETEDGGYSRRILFDDVIWSKTNGNPVDKPAGQKWVGDPDSIVKYGMRLGVIECEEETAESLIQFTYQKVLETKDPKVTYEAEVTEFEKYMDGAKLQLGDKVAIIDEELAFSLQARVIERQFSIIPEESKVIKIGNFIDTKIGLTLDDIKQEVDKIANQIQKPSTDGDDEVVFPDTVPSQSTLTAEGLFSSVSLSWTYENQPHYEYMLYASKTKGFTPTSAYLIYRGKASSFLHYVEPNETWYYRVRGVNNHGSLGTLSTEVKAETRKINDSTVYFEDMAIQSASIGSINADVINSGTIKAQHVDLKGINVTDGNGVSTFQVTNTGQVNMNVNSLSIKSKAVPTVTDVTTAKQEAIDSANGNTANVIKNYYTKEQTNSAINATKEEINLSVSNTYETKEEVITKINDIQIGGTNLVLNSDFSTGKRTNWAYSGAWAIHTTEKYKDKYIIYSSRTGLTSDVWTELRSNKIEAKEGETFTMSVDIKWQDILKAEQSVIAIWGYDSDGNNRKALKDTYISGSQDWDRIVLTGTVPTGVTHIRACISHKRNGSIYATNFKLEKGNKATGWSPAPEDVVTGITSAKNEAINNANSQLTETIKNYYTKTQTDSAINVAKDQINLGVSETYETKTNVTTKFNNAVSTASSDATTKANNALNNAKSYADTKKTEAINSANNTTTEKLKSYSTTSQMNSAISLAKNEINSSVSSTYTTKTEFSDMVVGGQNLLKNSNFHNKGNDWKSAGTSPTLTYGTSSVIDDTFITISRTGAASNGYSGITQIFANVIPSGTTLTFGFEYYASTAEWETWDENVRMEIKGRKDGATSDTVIGSIEITPSMATKDKWKREFKTITTDSKFTNVYAYVFVRKNGIVNVTRTFVQEGNKVTQWSLSPKDAQSSITSLQTRMNTAEQKITDSAIINTVSSTFVTKTDFNNLAIGGVNLYTNTKVINKSQWGNSDTWDTSETHNGFTVIKRTGAWLGLYRPDVNFELNETYTLSVWAKGDGDASLNFYSANSSISVLNKNFTQNSIISTDWVRYFITFKVKNTDVPLNARFENAIAKSTLSLYGFKLEKGNKVTDWSPAPEDFTNYADSVASEISGELGDLSEIVSLNNGSDALTPAMKSKLISEAKDVKSIYDNLSSMYQTVGNTSFSNLVTDMVNAHMAVQSVIDEIQDTVNETDESGLSNILEKFNAFYATADSLNQAIINALKGITEEMSTEISQLANSVEIKISEFNSSLGELTTRFSFGSDGLTIKSSANANKYIKLDNDSLDFMDNGNMVAQISDNQLSITNAKVKNQMKIGNISIKPSGKGGLMFVYE